MPEWPETLALAALATMYYCLIGLPLAQRTAPAGLPAMALAPALGWAVFSAIALPGLMIVGFDATSVRLVCGAAAVVAALTLQPVRSSPGVGTLATLLAAGTATVVLAAIMPKHEGDGVVLAEPMFDHVKIAVVDGIVRSGLPPVNPFFGGPGPSLLAYYYLWHFSAAALAEAVHVDAWSADAAMTGSTAFASMLLMIGIARFLSRRKTAAALAILLALVGTVRPVLDAILGPDPAAGIMPRDADLGGWLVQAAWVPQHMASACCVVLATLLLMRLTGRGGWLAALVLGVVAAAGFESSAWVGGITFVFAAVAAGVVLLITIPTASRMRFVLQAASAVLVAAPLAWPVIAVQLQGVSARQGGMPIALVPYGVLGSLTPERIRSALNVPAFWVLLLPAGLPAIYPLGLVAMLAAVRAGRALALVAVAGASLGVAWLLRSTIENNDLGWRAVVPAMLLLTPFAAAALGDFLATRRCGAAIAAALCAALGLPDTVSTTASYAQGEPSPDSAVFARSREAWKAVRRFAAPQDRVANNTMLARNVTPWPVNLSWAVLSRRPSCFASWNTVIAYGALPRARLEQLDGVIQRVFAGTVRDGDVHTIAWELDCKVALVLPGDGAWTHDPFRPGEDYVLVDDAPERWRIYVRR